MRSCWVTAEFVMGLVAFFIVRFTSPLPQNMTQTRRRKWTVVVGHTYVRMYTCTHTHTPVVGVCVCGTLPSVLPKWTVIMFFARRKLAIVDVLFCICTSGHDGLVKKKTWCTCWGIITICYAHSENSLLFVQIRTIFNAARGSNGKL